MKKIIFHVFFIVIVVLDLIGELTQIKWIDYSFKPLIMIWIATYFLTFAVNADKIVLRLAIIAFIFSWFGDIFLMFHQQFIFFILGLASFLVAQIVYTFLFLQTIKLSGKISFLKKRPYFLFFYIVYGLVIYRFLFPHLDTVLQIAVLVYMLAILSMSAMALNRFGNGHPLSFTLVFTGSVLFVISDSLIAVNRFVINIPYEGLFVMSTYISAQYLIMRGILKQFE